MKLTAEITESAERDVREAFLWYEDQREKLGLRFKESFIKAIEDICKNPLKYQIKYQNIRVRFLKKFPFGIHYTVNEERILIAAVFHTSIDPDNWKQKR